MANSNLTITEYNSPGFFAGQISAAQLPEIKAQQVLSSTTSQTVAFQNNTRLVRLSVDNTASGLGVCVATGAAPVASTTSARLALNQTEYFEISEAFVGKLSVAYIAAAN